MFLQKEEDNVDVRNVMFTVSATESVETGYRKASKKGMNAIRETTQSKRRQRRREESKASRPRDGQLHDIEARRLSPLAKRPSNLMKVWIS